jgi:hypothetical protein
MLHLGWSPGYKRFRLLQTVAAAGNASFFLLPDIEEERLLNQ